MSSQRVAWIRPARARLSTPTAWLSLGNRVSLPRRYPHRPSETQRMAPNLLGRLDRRNPRYDTGSACVDGPRRTPSERDKVGAEGSSIDAISPILSGSARWSDTGLPPELPPRCERLRPAPARVRRRRSSRNLCGPRSRAAADKPARASWATLRAPWRVRRCSRRRSVRGSGGNFSSGPVTGLVREAVREPRPRR